MMKQKGKARAKNPTYPGGAHSPVKSRKQAHAIQITALYLKGKTIEEISREMLASTGAKFGSAAINNVIKRATDQWKESTVSMIDSHKSIELQKVNNLEATYWEGWERSKALQKAKTKTKTAVKEGDKLGLSREETQERESPGDPRFLTGIQWCVDKRCELLGIVDQPTTAIQINNNNVGDKSVSTTIVRRVVFKTRETTSQPQILKEEAEA
jgi:hypothetical protein